ncbi:MAG: DsbC family protein [Granulosicoccus sp.]
MTTYKRLLPALAVIGVLSGGIFGAQQAFAHSDAAQAASEADSTSAGVEPEQLLETLGQRLPGIAFSDISESNIPGLYEVVSDGQIYYVDESAEYLIDGSLIRLSDRANLTDARLGRIHMSLIEDMDEKDMLIYEPETASNRSITVFTDISCGYCRRLHAELDTLLEEGVRVRYLLFPRAGLDSQGRKDLESVWCADNPQDAMTNAKAGGEIVPKTCDSPIEKHVALAERLGLRGTPLIYTDSGEKIPGYREASVLATMVNGSEPISN